MSIFCTVDDKFVPLYRVMWVAATPHFCGEEDCMREGYYEVRLEQGESVWATAAERDKMLEQLEEWQGGLGPGDPHDDEQGLVAAGEERQAVSHAVGPLAPDWQKTDRIMASNKPPQDNNPANDELHWRETYFIVFPHGRRPTLAQVKQALGKADPRLLLENLAGDPQGRFESVLIESLEDHAAVEVSYETGDAVVEQNLEWAKQLRKQASSQQLQLLMTADARLDVAHFERLPAGGTLQEAAAALILARYDEGLEDELGGSSWSDDEAADYDAEDAEPEMDMLDPSCLLIVVETLSALTGGLAYDPASGEVL